MGFSAGVVGFERGSRFKEVRGPVAKMDSEEALEDPGATLEVAERAVAEKGRLIHKEEAGGHDGGKTHNASMRLLIGGEIVGFEGDG